eukprot:m.617258 g.617258  ORF g.617258 m.617258 type:complete len:311 (+) comp22518_c0_seq8:153-1085(+)
MSDSDDGRICRICYGEDDGEENGVLFRPCLCRGSCGVVHVNCLDEWRKQSTNPNSAFRCDQCKYEYKFGENGNETKLFLASVMNTRWFVEIASLFVLATIIVVTGIIMEWWNSDLFFDGVAVIPSYFTRVGIQGASAVGFSSFFFTVLSGPLRMMRLFDVGHGHNDGCAKAVMIVIGLVAAYYQVYKRLRQTVKRGTQKGTQVMLDVHGRMPQTATDVDTAPTTEPVPKSTEADLPANVSDANEGMNDTSHHGSASDSIHMDDTPDDVRGAGGGVETAEGMRFRGTSGPPTAPSSWYTPTNDRTRATVVD